MSYQTTSSDAAELQEVLTRYVDSRDGYIQASLLVEEPGLVEAFKAIAHRRQDIAGRVAAMIREQGTPVDAEGSPEAGVHRWWIRLRDQMTTTESKTILEECLRGENELARTLTDALEHGHLTDEHQLIIREALAEVEQAILAFSSAVGHE